MRKKVANGQKKSVERAPKPAVANIRKFVTKGFLALLQLYSAVSIFYSAVNIVYSAVNMFNSAVNIFKVHVW
jgi:hypothetical protein